MDSNKIIQLVEKRYQIITHFELYKTFFEQDLDKETAKEFFRKVAYENTAYYPIYYYLVTANLNLNSVEKILQKEKGAKVGELKKRLDQEKNKLTRFESGKITTDTDAARSITTAFESLKNKSEFDFKNLDSSSLRYIIQAITHLKLEDIDKSYVLNILKELYDNHFNQSSTTKSFIRKAICHIDLIIFGDQFFKNAE